MLIVRGGESCFSEVWHQLRLSVKGITALYTNMDMRYLIHTPDTWQPEVLNVRKKVEKRSEKCYSSSEKTR
jgi:hypothetical protein